MIKGQDIVVLTAIMGSAVKLPYSELAEKSRLSVSETHAAVKRLQEASLVNGERKVVRRNAAEFLVHGLKYAFPLKSTGGYDVGMPTLYAAPVAEDEFVSVGSVPVWTNSDGSVEGIGFVPIYPTAPKAAQADRGMYDRLALIDMLRGGRLRERKYAEDKLMEMLYFQRSAVDC